MKERRKIDLFGAITMMVISMVNLFVVMSVGAGLIGSSIASEVVITIVLIAVAVAIRMFMDKRYKEKNEIE